MIKLSELNALFQTEDDCKQFLFTHRWPDGVRCPRCDNEKVYALKQPWKWQCQSKTCGKRGYRFSLISGTIFENTKYPLKTWFTVAFMMLHSKKGMSALQIKRMIFNDKASYETVWYMCTRIRAAMKNEEFSQLMGIVEVDETFVGGKDKNRHFAKRRHITGGSGKTTVIGAISRKGSVVCKVIENTSAKTLNSFVREAISDKVDLIATDEFVGYSHLNEAGFPHDFVRHGANQYVVRGNVHTNNIENFWSLLKRGIVGTYHKVSKDYLPMYLAEFTFRHNNRKNEDMFGTLIAGC
jgi:transposase-like protein